MMKEAGQMAKKRMALLLALVVLCTGLAVCADSFPDIPEEKLLEALKSSMPEVYYPNCEFFGAGYTYLGQETQGRTRRVYLAASVGGYGFMGDAFVMQSGWGSPCTAVFVYRQGGWRFQKLLDIESWSEVHTIMPRWAVEKWKTKTDDQAIQKQISLQVQAYLDSIGRTEPVRETADMALNLSGMPVPASNFLSWIDWAYPLWTTTRERLDQQDGQRYLYTRSWEPDPEGPADPRITTKHGLMDLQGRPGTQTLTKTRKSDGRALETTVIKVEMERLTISMRDEWGSASYVFAFDPWEITYRKPAVTREGACRMDTRGLDRAIDELPGEKRSQAVEEASVTVREGERFTVYKDGSINTLAYSRLTGGQWQEVWRNDMLLPRTNQKIYLSAHPTDEPSLHVMPRHSVKRLSGLSIYAGEEHPDLAIDLYVNERDVWQVDLYDWMGERLFAQLFEDGIFLNLDTFSAHSTGDFIFMPVNRDAATFDARTIFTARDTLNGDIEGAPRMLSPFLDAEPMYINLKKDVRLPVYLTPNLTGLRAARGKAAVSLKDWVVVLAKQDSSMCILYETTPGSYRVGWVDGADDPQLRRLLEITMPACFEENKQGITLRKTTLYDDPLSLSGSVLDLKKGQSFRVLHEGNDSWYVEIRSKGQIYWGFVNIEDVKMKK